MAEQDPEKLADELERQSDELDRHSDEVEKLVAETRQDWERKRADESVPGAPPREQRDEEAPSPEPSDEDS